MRGNAEQLKIPMGLIPIDDILYTLHDNQYAPLSCFEESFFSDTEITSRAEKFARDGGMPNAASSVPLSFSHLLIAYQHVHAPPSPAPPLAGPRSR